MPSYFYDRNSGKMIRTSPLPIRITLDFSNPPDIAMTPHTEMMVQVTLSAQAHPDDVAAVLERIQAAIKDATAATGGRIGIEFAVPDIFRETELPAETRGSGGLLVPRRA